MQRDRAKKLEETAAEIACEFSRPDRQYNYQQEIFEVTEISPLTELTAAIIFSKSPTGKQALAFAYWINSRGGSWRYFFPADSHVLGMGKIGPYLEQVEKHNYQLNF